MVVRLIELVTKPNRSEDICREFDNWALPVARIYPGFYEGMCLVLRPEKRIMMVFTRWDSQADADRYFDEVYSSIVSLVRPWVDKITVREFNVMSVMTAGRETQSTIVVGVPSANQRQPG